MLRVLSPSMSDHEIEITVRRAVAADISGLVECSAGLFAEDAGTRDDTVNVDWPREHGPDRFAQTIHERDRLVLVADRGGVIVGCLTGVIAEPSPMRLVKIATLVSMFVRPELRGSGLGARLADAFFAWSKEHGAAKAEVTAYAGNSGAINFYERNGFRRLSVTLEQLL
jgi:GNAT superfamily N-acetyltransferase